MNFYIADTHFGHDNILHYDNRPYNTCDEMEEDMVKKWNDAVSDSDTVYILGDFCWGNESEWIRILDRLNGHKVLIKGNHDIKISDNIKNKFDGIFDYKEIKDNGVNVVLCHYPIPCYNKQYYGSVMLYGHVHISFQYEMMEHDKKLTKDLYDKPCLMYNVGCMVPYMNYTPRILLEILTYGEES